MCLILLAYQAHPRYRLIVAANRDEFFRRPTAAAGWWGEGNGILAGRDLEAGGTWLGVTRHGRFAALTNYRDPPAHQPQAPSRGGLVTGFLAGQANPHDYLSRLQASASRYNGFNLLVADAESLVGFCNRGGGVQVLPPGVHGISNGLLDEAWPKVIRGRAALAKAVEATDEPASDALFELLADRTPAAEAELPNTGVSPEWERWLSSRFISAPGYGTRSSTVLLWEYDNAVRFVERSFDEKGAVSGNVDVAFSVVA